MELPIAQQSYAPSADVLVRAIKRADVVLARMAAEETELAGAAAFTNPARPDITIANFAADLRVPEGVTAEEVVREVLDHYAAAGVRCRKLMSADTGWPAELAAALRAQGYAEGESAGLYRLARRRATAAERLAADLQVIPARAAYPQTRRLYHDMAVSDYALPAAAAERLAATLIDHLDEPRLEAFLGRLEQRPAGVVSVLTLGNIGVIDFLGTLPEFRRRGVARTLLAHALEFCERSQFEQVILEARERSPAVPLYESAGFVKQATFHAFHLAG